MIKPASLLRTPLVALLLAAALLWVASEGRMPAQAPPPSLTALETDGGSLLDASPFQEQLLVTVGEAKSGAGTAFAVAKGGTWMTARHVVDACDRVSLLVGPGQYVPVDLVKVDERSDLALLYTATGPDPLAFDLNGLPERGEAGFHPGYPQGQPGEAVTVAYGTSELVLRGRRDSRETVVAWAELGRTEGLDGSLAGISGAPLLGADGAVRGVTLAESPRRGRLYTASPDSVRRFLSANGIPAAGASRHPMSIETYGQASDGIRRALQVVKVACDVRKRG